MSDIRDDRGEILFATRELACRATGVVRLAPGFAGLLRDLRLAWARPMAVTSCCRAKAHNDKPRAQGGAGGHPRSLHVYDAPHWPTGGACAIDVHVPDAQVRMQLALCAAALGWSVGVPAGNFIHLDRRELGGLKPRALFGYGG